MALLIAGFPEVAEIGKRVAKKLRASYTTIFVKDFPDSEFHLKLKKDPRNKIVVILNSMAHNPDEKLIETMLAAGVARDYRAKKVILVATYMPYMRQDKHFLKYDSFSSKHVIKLLSEFDKIIALDPHLHRLKSMKELSKKAESISAAGLIADYIHKRFKDKFTIIGPDEESWQWSRKIAGMLGRKVMILKKVRYSPKHVKIKERKIGDNIIIIDDIISTGHTIAETIKMAKKHGAKKVVCIGIHGVLVDGADKLIRKNAELITTNSIPNPYAKIDVSPVIIEALRKYA